MSLKMRFRFDGRCTRHPRYNPPTMGAHITGRANNVSRSTSFHLYIKIAERRAEDPKFIVAGASADREGERAIDVVASSESRTAS